MTDPTRIAAAILAFTADYPATFGRHRMARVLVGNVNEDDLDRVPELPVRGALEGETQVSVVKAIDALIDGGAIVASYGDRPRLALTRRGWSYLAALEMTTTMEVPTT